MNLTNRQISLLKKTFLDYRATSDFIETPLVIERARRLYYWDENGKQYFDGIDGIFVASLGHGHPDIIAALQRVEQSLVDALDILKRKD